MSVEKIITDNLDIWTSAIKTKSASGRGSNNKLELYGIKKLRELILELAVRGKLVPQNPDDEPAANLLERIDSIRDEKHKAGILKAQKKAYSPDAPNPVESLPNGWIAADFGDITFNRDAERIPLSVNERKGMQGQYDYYGASGVIDSVNRFLFDKPLLLIGEDGANLVNRSTPIAFIARGKYWVNNHAHVIDSIDENLLEYLALYINSISLIPYITGMAQPKMNQARMNGIEVWLPPEKEQKRIVAKVNELMALCDQLESQTEASIEAHQTLVKTLLETLTSAKDADELNESWLRISEHFDVLFTTEDSIDQLKQTILQLAVMGKLVKQDPNDEPASKLLERIAAEKEQLIKDKKIKKQKPLPPVSDEEKPFELPAGWEFARMGHLALYQKGYAFKSADYLEEGVMIAKIQNITENSIENAVYIAPEKAVAFEQYELAKGDLVMTTVGSWFSAPKSAVGRTFLIDNIFNGALLNQNTVRIRPFDGLIPQYLFACVNSFIFKKYLIEEAQGTANQASITQDSIKNFVIALPPAEAQLQIVEKVSTLFAICDSLIEKHRKAENYRLELSEALVAKVA